MIGEGKPSPKVVSTIRFLGPAANSARREGIDIVLDPMWSHIGDALNEHIDGLRSTAPRPMKHEAG